MTETFMIRLLQRPVSAESSSLDAKYPEYRREMQNLRGQEGKHLDPFAIRIGDERFEIWSDVSELFGERICASVAGLDRGARMGHYFMAETMSNIMPEIAYKKMNLPLPPKVHEALFAESRLEGVPATRLVRSVLEDWLRGRQRARTRDEVRRYALEQGGTDLDLDPLLEENALEEMARFYEHGDAAG